MKKENSHYKSTEFYAPHHERAFLWDDTDLAIAWPEVNKPFSSIRNAAAMGFSALCGCP